MKNLLVPTILLLCYSGNQVPDHAKTVSSKSNDKLLVINCENILNNKKMVRLSQVASDVRYIQLETNPSCLLSNLRSIKFLISDSLIFVQNLTHVLKFSIDGKFIKRITNPGRGPGETGNIRSMSVIPNKRLLIIHQRNKLLYFSFNGELVKSLNIPFHQEVKVLNDSRYITFDPATNGSEKYNFILASNLGDTISSVTNYTIWKKGYPGNITTIGPANEAFYLSNNSYYFKTKYNDTVYSVNIAKDKIEPSYVIDFGKYKTPDDLIMEKVVSDPIKFQKFSEKAVNFYWGRPFEAFNKVFIRLSCMGKLDIKYLLYDKANYEGALLINESGESTGILNDWDGSMDFWPTIQKNDSEIIMPIDVAEFKKKIESTSSDKRIIKYPDKLKTLKSRIAGLDDLDNPILMVITLKK